MELALLLMVWALFGPACDKTQDPGNQDAGPPIPAAGLCDELPRLLCDAATRCCGTASPDCVTTQTTRCEETLGRAARVASTGYDGSLGRVAINEATDRMERCDPELANWIRDRAGFLAAFTGTRDPFDLCRNDEPSLERAVSCRGSNSCQRTPTEDRCRSLLEPGEVCQSDFDCPPERFCQVECRATRAPDATCFRSQMCDSGVCRRGICREESTEEVYCFLGEFDFFGVVDPPAP